MVDYNFLVLEFAQIEFSPNHHPFCVEFLMYIPGQDLPAFLQARGFTGALLWADCCYPLLDDSVSPSGGENRTPFIQLHFYNFSRVGGNIKAVSYHFFNFFDY